MRWSLMLMLAAGCVEDASHLDEQQAAVPRPELNLWATHFEPGTTPEVTVVGAPPRGRVYLAYSPNGPGDTVCPPAWGEVCAGLANPISVVATATANTNGEAVFQVPLPNQLPFDEAWLQAAVPGDPPHLSRPFHVDIGPPDPEWDGVSMPRLEGPNAFERNKYTAWEIQNDRRLANVTTTLGMMCDPTEPGWSDVFTPPQYDPGYFYYSFHMLSPDGLTAQHLNCGLGFPSACVPTYPSGINPIFGVVDNRMSFTFPTSTTWVGGCSVEQQITWELVDNGEVGSFNIHVDIGVGSSCPSRVNDGCSFQHSVDLEFYDVRP